MSRSSNNFQSPNFSEAHRLACISTIAELIVFEHTGHV